MAQKTLDTTMAKFVRGSGDPHRTAFSNANDNFTELYAILSALLGASLRSGTATLVGGTVTVADTATTANSQIFAFCQTPGGTPGFLRCSARVADTSFTILSSSGTDTSAIAYFIIEPAA